MNSLIPEYVELHKKGWFPGLSIRPYVEKITTLVMESGAKTLLDYGCGQGKQYKVEYYHIFWNIYPTLYDPAVSDFATRPKGQFDGVICTDVLEHVPEHELDAVIADLVGYARLWCFMSVCCRPSKQHRKVLADGRNIHVTIRPPAWWQEKLKRAFTGKATMHLEFTP